jgi:hypothetical protein
MFISFAKIINASRGTVQITPHAQIQAIVTQITACAPIAFKVTSVILEAHVSISIFI